MTSGSGAALLGPPLKAVLRRTTRPSWRRPVLWIQVLLIFGFVQLYDIVRNFAPTRSAQAFNHADTVLTAEHDLGISIEHMINGWLAGHPDIAIPTDWYYDSAHYVVTFSLLVFIYFRRAAAYRRLRNALLLTNMVGLLGFWLYPLAPPRMLPGFTDTVLVFNTPLATTITNGADQFAAMPSLHIGWAVWVAAATYTITSRRWVRVVATVYPFLTLAVVLSTANHYVLDVLAGALCAFIGLTVPAVLARLNRARVLACGADAAATEPTPAQVELGLDPISAGGANATKRPLNTSG